MDLNFNEMCRLCAKKCDDMQNIFQDFPAETRISMDVTRDMSGMLALKIVNATSIKVLRKIMSMAALQIISGVGTCSNYSSNIVAISRASQRLWQAASAWSLVKGGCILRIVLVHLRYE